MRLSSYHQIVDELGHLRDRGAELFSIGKSGLGREIYLLTIGKDDKRVLIVCRQHGNEPTSTEAMMEYAGELLDEEDLMEKVRVSIIPMANPDGAELYRKVCEDGRTSILISYIACSVKPYRGDMNRDYKKKKFPETKIVAKAIKETKPNIIIDLHNFFLNYEYLILRKPIHDFCAAISTHPKIKPRIFRKTLRICKIAIKAVRREGGNPADINGL
ncbi:MAG: M14 family zinc carboxypeptidase [Candidatus Bathyarchaeota archaeon]|nr:M14 family zinc carboxypeptidase [Candidatus Bathyarchaeota archaeon]MDH5495614.1 M14 family zinc carboxypeptidase [Candidatus Bathyarchaeota archaeon]